MKTSYLPRILISLILLLLVSVSPIAAKPKLPPNVELLSGVKFGSGGGRALLMEILRPRKRSAEALPALVWVHGGGWRGGDRFGGLTKLLPFTQAGYFCASIEYRLSQEAVFPAQIQDCKCAIRFLRAQSIKYNLDPQKIGAWGGSAGGHLVALLGTSGDVKALEGSGGWPDASSRVQAVCDWFGPADLRGLARASPDAVLPVTQLLGGAVAERPELATQASPVCYVTPDDPPFLIMHGDRDQLVPVSQSILLDEALRKAGVDAKLIIIPGAGHGFGGAEQIQAVREFFDRVLRKPTAG